ncbi:TPA: beta-galactosidase [Burkholderia vietnamiensis]|nr:beta-galactosidase [Burkholderia vietnamiensis]
MNRRGFLLAAAIVPLFGACSRDYGLTSEPNRRLPIEPTPLDPGKHELKFGSDGVTFTLDGAAFQIRSGEMHPSRIPPEYWRHRIQMAKAMGMNTIAVYVMWNFHEVEKGTFDFESEERNIEAFIKLCRDEGMWVLLRPGPYICGEWDLGGLPAYLLSHPDIKLRVSSHDDPRYMEAVKRYVTELAPRVKPLMSVNGGPILMLQIENEYATYGSDTAYLEEIRQLWIGAGISGPFFTDDGVTQLQKSRTALEGAAIGLSGPKAKDIAHIRKEFPGSTVMAGELYPGFFTHWGDKEFQGTKSDVSREIADFMRFGVSFSLYVIHGGTSFGYAAGANIDSKTGEYQPDITSYDYFAPISEQGAATARYMQYREIIGAHLSRPLPAVPAAPATLERYGDSALRPYLFASVWDNLPEPIKAAADAAPAPFEYHGQSSGFVLYRRELDKPARGQLELKEVHDYATVFAGGDYIGGVTRAKMPRYLAEGLGVVKSGDTLALDAAGGPLDVLVEGMGRVNYGDDLIDRKGITESVTLSARELTGWQTHPLPMDEQYIAALRNECSDPRRPGLFFKATLMLSETADTFIDMKDWIKGIVWVNGRNLGRYWHIGPQYRLFCPAPFLKPGYNEITVFDLHQVDPAPINLLSTIA